MSGFHPTVWFPPLGGGEHGGDGGDIDATGSPRMSSTHIGGDVDCESSSAVSDAPRSKTVFPPHSGSKTWWL
ncbi:MAG: hypothetical protein GWP47_14810 [Actinobacteria bacterium]|nr:hypothetical protein [Actinomycetota bacterium]